jgi:hypothetical protein
MLTLAVTSSTSVILPLLLPPFILRWSNTDVFIIGDVGGQKTLRSYWRNYFEKTDALIWVVDATDRLRIDDCKEELHGLLQEEVCDEAPGCLLLCFTALTVFPVETLRGKSLGLCE